MNKDLAKLAFINRQPTLWRHGIGVVKILPSDESVIEVSPLMIEPFNMDFDGDSILSDILIKHKEEYKILHISEFSKIFNCTKKDERNNIENYNVHDNVYIKAINSNGVRKYKRITAWSIHKNLVMFKISVKPKVVGITHFEPIQVSEDHSLIVFNKKTQSIEKKSPLELIKNKDNYFLILDKEKIQAKENLFTESFGWLVGSWLGDGSIFNEGRMISFSNSDNTLLDKFEQCLYDYGVTHISKYGPNQKDNDFSKNYICKKASYIRSYSPKLCSYLINNFGKSSSNKTLPINILNKSDKFLYGLFAGYIDTDGTINTSNINFTSKSKSLLKMIKYTYQCRFNLKMSSIYEYQKNIVDNHGNKTDQIGTYYMLHCTVTRDTIEIISNIKSHIINENKKEKINTLITNARNKQYRRIHYIPRDEVTSINFSNCSAVSRTKIRKNEYVSLEFDYMMDGSKYNQTVNNIINAQINNRIELIPCSYLNIEKSDETTAYDLTVEDYYTFITADRLYVQDTAAIYIAHDIDALQEMNDKAYIKNTIRYDSDERMLSVVRHEALFGAYILTENVIPSDIELSSITSIDELPEDIDLFNSNLSDKVIIQGKPYTYGVCLLNKWCGFDDILINQTIGKKSSNLLSETIYNFYGDNDKYYDALTELNKKLLFFITITEHCPSLNVNEMIDILKKDIEELFHKLPYNNPKLGYIINEGLVERCLNMCNEESSLLKLFKSGSRFDKQQLSRCCLNIGYTADDQNIIESKPIKSNLLRGLNAQDFFLGSAGTRKGISDKSAFTPQSGYMERTLTMALSPLEIVMDDCDCQTNLQIKVLNEKHVDTLVGKYFYNFQDRKWDEFTKEFGNKIIGKDILIRSPITCEAPNFAMCRMCYGTRQHPTQYLGITAAQCLSERLTQLIMRSFHTSGSANLTISTTIKNLIANHLIDIIEEKDLIILKFDTVVSDNYDKLSEINGFVDVNGNMASFEKVEDKLLNEDTVYVMLAIKNLLKTQKKTQHHQLNHPVDYYMEMIKYILQVGAPYSSFVEMLFANMFVCDDDATEFWRYNKDKEIIKKLGDKTLSYKINKLLGVLYQPNKRTLDTIGDKFNMDASSDQLNIYERIWLGKFD